jgi:hypothetical protein
MRTTFDELAASRREWIETVLKPWCLKAPWKELRRAELEWSDIAGRVDPEATLWTWAWSRFPDLVHEGIAGVNETCQVRVELRDGTTVVGYPDARQSRQGRLVLLSATGPGRLEEHGPYTIDEVASVSREE